MGTSKSNSGPKDKIPLLPEWALPPVTNPELPPEEQVSGPPQTAAPSPGNNDSEADSTIPQATIVSQVAPIPAVQSTWRSARLRLGKVVTKSSYRNKAFKRAAQSYVRAQGGARRASQNSLSGRSATVRLGGFLSDVVRHGLNAALGTLNLASVVGRDAKTVFAAISNALSPEGALPEQAVAREAVNDVLAHVYEEFVGDDGDLSRLDALTADDVANAIRESVAAYIFRRWLQELGKQIEQKAVDAAHAVGLENEARLFVQDSVKLDLQTLDPLAIDWTTQGNDVVERIYNQAFSLFGAGK